MTKEFPHNIKAALIDMDGTLYDSMRAHTAAWHRMMNEIDIDIPRDEFYLYEGMTGAATINLIFSRELGRLADEDEIRELYGRKTRYFRELDEGTPMPGATEMLAALRRASIECIVVTGSGQQSLLDKLSASFPGVFSQDKMVTARDVTKGKPDPEPYLKAMQRAGVDPDECIVIENAPLGVRSGAASGAFTIGVLTGPVPSDEMIKAGADMIFDSMPDLASFLSEKLRAGFK